MEKEKKVKEEKKGKIDNNKKKPDILLIALYVVLFIVVVALIVIKIKNIGVLPNDNELVVELNDYFSTSDLGLCNGLFNYGEKKITYNDVDSASKICIAYHKSDIKSAKALTYDAKKKDSTCNVDGMIFKTDEGVNTCTVSKLDREVVDKTYKKLFGKDIEDNESFKYDGYHVCYLKDDSYYCGLSELYSMTVGVEVNVYRSVEKAIKKKDTITIYDYFAKVTGSGDQLTCYKDINDICNKNLKNEDLKYEFLEKYGIKYKHTFKKASDGTYYWVSTEPVADPNTKE